jgi:hypothetical protein
VENGMPRLGNLDFDYQILEAIKDGRFVVFAGAGVSMGPPSNLESFWTLAQKVADGTGLAPEDPLDRFLGGLHHRRVKVHERALAVLSPPGSAPTGLHRDLVRLFGAVDRIKVVTTNFDLHFETAAKEVFGAVPEVYRAPALPLGHNFQGIVHVHGAQPHASSIVLTDADFGRAYLTEGWARRFLLDVFRSHTVLFVGYSHDDVVMNYLARALPPDASAGRFALTETDGHWNLLGIRPIRFTKGVGADPFHELNDGVAKLAERGARGTLAWQARMFELVGRAPPVDPELVDEVLQALRDVTTCRFFSQVARDVSWPKWLDARALLDALFQPGDLDERQRLLAFWLAEHYALEHPEACLELIVDHGLRVNPLLWLAIGGEVGGQGGKPLTDAALRQWVSLLLAAAPEAADRHVFMSLSERCDAAGLHDCSLMLFLHLCRHKFEIKKGFAWRDDDDEEPPARYRPECTFRTEHWSLNEIYERRIKPHMANLVQPLLSGMVHRFASMHEELSTWSGREAWEAVSFGRSAIEPHEQDHFTETADVLIDAARDALEWLAANAPAQLDAWIELLTGSRSSILRRLAVHAVVAAPTRSADARLAWLLERIGVGVLPEHHEVHRLVELNYAQAGEAARRALIDAIVAVQFEDVEGRPGEVRALRFQFDWLSWLLAAKPDCALAQAALAPIHGRFPDWAVSEHPDLTHWMGASGWVEERSPWSTEELLAQPAPGQVDGLLAFQGTPFAGPSREGLLSALRDAAKTAPAWGFDLAAELQRRELWSSDLWSTLLRGFQDAELDQAGWERLLAVVANAQLHADHARDIADLLLRLVKDGGKPFALAVLDRANAVAEAVWAALTPGDDSSYDNWLTLAINRPAGILVEYWLAALSLTLGGKEGADWRLPQYYRDRFTTALQDASFKGANARAVVASQTAYLFRLDETWAREHLVPLFQDADADVFAQAWQGFLAWGRLYPQLAQALQPAFIAALGRADDQPGERSRLIEFYTALCAFHVDDPLRELLPALFQQGTLEDRRTFASQIEYFLRQLNPESTTRLWNAWLSRYWQNRLEGILSQLEPAECREMIEWLPHLGEHYPAAVALATQMPPLAPEDNHALYELRDSVLVDQYPQDTARLLIYLANGIPGYQVRYLADVSARLVALPDELRQRLDEALARAGA